MNREAGSQRYIYRTEGVCPPEIHFRIEGEVIREICFVGGGCPGNAQLVGRLVEDQPLEKILGLLDGIECRNNTSCPDQLLRALTLVRNGKLLPSRSFRITADTRKRKHLALVGDLGGRLEVWKALAAEIKKTGIRTLHCLGNLTDPSREPHKLLRALIHERALLAIQGEGDWLLAGNQSGLLSDAEKEYLSHLGQAVSFRLGNRKGLGFFGQYLQDLPGYSDFEPYSLEMNMVVNLTRFMEDETVFPALEAMIPQFEAKVIVFSQRQKWGHWTIGNVDFISLGPAWQDNQLAWGILEERPGQVQFRIERRPLKIKDKGSRDEDKE
jgi:uncharacterized protein (TIGR03905 family)